MVVLSFDRLKEPDMIYKIRYYKYPTNTGYSEPSPRRARTQGSKLENLPLS